MELVKRISEEQLKERTGELAALLTADIAGQKAVLVANLKGSVIFFSDLIRRLERTDIEIDFVSVRSYEGSASTGKVTLGRDLNLDVRGKTVVLVEDIVDTGLTLSSLIRYIKDKHQPSRIIVCVLLDKPARRQIEVQVDHSGFLVGDEFLVGYGLDYNEHYRNLPYIGVLTGI
jgi:hypoxanthine phosphoribosyltransferase